MSKYFKTYSLTGSSTTAHKTSITSAIEDVKAVPSHLPEKNIYGYTQHDLFLFDQLTQTKHHVARKRPPSRAASNAQQEYTTQDADHFLNLMQATETDTPVARHKPSSADRIVK